MSLFLTSDGGLRAGWRLAVFVLALLAGWIAANAVVYPLFHLLSAWRGAPITAFPWVALTGAFVAHAILLEWLAPLPWQDAALGRVAWRTRALGGGLLLGALLVIATMGVGFAAQHFALERTTGTASEWWDVALRLAWLLAPAALWEELVFRGYLLSVTRELIGTRGALVATSVAFAVVHADNPGAGPLPLLVVFTAGIALGAIRVRFDSVPAAWLAHFAWNWLLAAGLHADVSGLAFGTPRWHLVEQGPDWLTGGTWGPEGGLYALVAFGAVSAWALRAPSVPATPPRETRSLLAA
ncbi:MAG: CPBP family intramembrane metalloprotease [Gemmatimonadaceae bacterium]|nr:CPBP family intramembrane metalloprotease [Gemmatimonadaceae bacterium]